MNTTHTGIALIGAGMIAQRHIEAVSAIGKNAPLDVVMSRHPDKAKHLAEFYKGEPPLFTSNITDITNNSDVKLVIMATPPSVRKELITELVHAGKHILLEKPVARTLDEAEEVVTICEQANVLLGIVFQHRMRASSRAAAQIVASGTLGKPGLIDISVPLWRDQSYYDELGRGSYERDGGGVLLTQAIHTIDLALSLTGPITSVQAITATTPLHSMESEDFAVAGLHFASGAVGSLVASTATFPHGRETITLHCEHGSLYLEADSLKVHWRDGSCESVIPVIDNSDDKVVDVAKYRLHKAVIENFLDAMHSNREPMVCGRTALKAHQLIQAVEVSSRKRAAIDL